MIPAQRSPSDVPANGTPAPGSGPGETDEFGARGLLDDASGMDLDELRTQRRLLTDELRGVRYWRRIAQAQADLLIASLVYTGHADLDGLHGSAAPARRPDAGARLEHLRSRNLSMAAYEKTLSADLDVVTCELATRVTASLAAAGGTLT